MTLPPSGDWSEVQWLVSEENVRISVSSSRPLSAWQVCWVWWPTWCSPRPSNWPSAWAQRTGNLKHGTTAGRTCEFHIQHFDNQHIHIGRLRGTSGCTLLYTLLLHDELCNKSSVVTLVHLDKSWWSLLGIVSIDCFRTSKKCRYHLPNPMLEPACRELIPFS